MTSVTRGRPDVEHTAQAQDPVHQQRSQLLSRRLNEDDCNIRVDDQSVPSPAIPATVPLQTAQEAPLVDVYPYGTPASEILHHLNKNNKNYDYSHVKTVHYLRHAQGEHNVNKEYRAVHNLDAPLTQVGKDQCRTLADRILHHATTTTTTTNSESNNNDSDFTNLYDMYHNAQLCVTSPMTRCIQTTLLSMEPLLQKKNELKQNEKGVVVPVVVAHEGIRETVNYNCDRRRTLDELVQEFPQVDFSPMMSINDNGIIAINNNNNNVNLHNNNEDTLWQSYVNRLGCEVTYPHHRESAEIYKVANRARSFLEWLRERPEDHVVICSHAAFSRCLWNFGLEGHVPLLMPQKLDDRVGQDAVNVPIVQYCGPKGFAEALRANYDNCELRSMVLAFRRYSV